MRSDYLKLYSDTETYLKWVKENIEDSSVPPIYFKADGISSKELKWEKLCLGDEEYTDYPESAMPVKRIARKYRYDCKALALAVELTRSIYDKYPIAEYDAELLNLAEENSPIITELSGINAAICSNAADVVIHYNEGGHYSFTCFAPYQGKAKEGEPFKLNSGDGLPTDIFIPCFNLENEAEKKGVISVINWQGDWNAEFSVKDNELFMNGNQGATEISMIKGEKLRLPGIVLLFYKNGNRQYGQNIWRRWIVEHNLMRHVGRRDFKTNVSLCSPFQGTESDLRAVEKFAETTNILKKYNCALEFDSGWYDNYTGDWHYTGSYEPSVKYSHEGFKQIGDKCREKGMGFCMWFEPERAYHKSKQAMELGDDMIYISPEGEYLTHKEFTEKDYKLSGGLWESYENGMVNYGKDSCVDYIVDLIGRAVKNYGITIFRQDFNRDNSSFWTAYDKHEAKTLGIPRKGAAENHCTTGYLKAWKTISEKNPGLIFDACAGGGRRLDLETVRFSFAHTKTDYWRDTVSAQCQNFGAYSWYIFTGTGMRTRDNIYDLRSSLNLSIGASGNENTNMSTIETALDEIFIYTKYLYKDFYQLSKYTTSFVENMAMQFNDHENDEGMMIAYVRLGGEFTFLPMGLDPETEYELWEQDLPEKRTKMRGEELMSKGYRVFYDALKPVAPVVWYKKV
ncbi:MAG: hypothetical protein E7623_02990 [Ruminococcaceae bacterium]|nr:hypothetical protein [Oscillospiraceae bacterium]